MKKIITVLLSVLLISGAVSCKKNSDGGSNSNADSKTVMIKLTLSPVPAGNQGSFSGAVNAILPSQKLATWKVNGVLRSNETTIAFSAPDFQNGVLTLETTEAVTTANLSIAGVTTSQYPYTATVQPTINGKANDPVSIAVASTMQRSFTY
jgi:hypothetical protein